jgi:hypothetical protein
MMPPGSGGSADPSAQYAAQAGQYNGGPPGSAPPGAGASTDVTAQYAAQAGQYNGGPPGSAPAAASPNPYGGGPPPGTTPPGAYAGAGGTPGAEGYASGYPGAGGYGQPGEQEKVDPEVEANLKKIEELYQERTWSDATGKFSFQGKFVDYSSGKVTLQKAGVEQNITLEMKQLSEGDQKYIRDGLKAQADQKKREEQQKIRDLRRRPRERDGNR